MSVKRKNGKIILLVILAVVLLAVVGCGIYLGSYYHADEAAMAAFESDGFVTVTEQKGRIVAAPAEPEAGLIFYPGGKVEHTAYIPLMRACAEEGILCVLVEMPFRLAVLDMDAADGIQAEYPQITHWYIGGHSLGGSMAAAYLAKHTADYQGLILLGSYSTADLSGTGLEVLSVYGSEDRVMNRENYEQYRANLPENFTEVVLEGGCHAYFGMYGAQAGDGTPAISNEEQIRATAEAIASLLEEQPAP